MAILTACTLCTSGTPFPYINSNNDQFSGMPFLTITPVHLVKAHLLHGHRRSLILLHTMARKVRLRHIALEHTALSAGIAELNAVSVLGDFRGLQKQQQMPQRRQREGGLRLTQSPLRCEARSIACSHQRIKWLVCRLRQALILTTMRDTGRKWSIRRHKGPFN